MFPLSIQRRIDNLRCPFRPAPNDREIFLVKSLLLNEQSKPARGRRCFRHKNQAARLAIKAVYNRNLTAIRNFKRQQLAKFVQQHMTSDPRRLTFVIGGYEGLADSVKSRADVQWSLSSLTFTHDLTRVVLLEQLYRALSIIHNLPYSK